MRHSKKPNLIFKRRIWKAILVLWIFIWACVFFKNLLFKGQLKGYTELLKRKTLEAKRAFVTGDHLYELIQFCKANLPEDATFGCAGIADRSLSDWRIRYYLYPRLRVEDPEYMIVYNEKKQPDAYWAIHKMLDGKRYILKRTDEQ